MWAPNIPHQWAKKLAKLLFTSTFPLKKVLFKRTTMKRSNKGVSSSLPSALVAATSFPFYFLVLLTICGHSPYSLHNPFHVYINDETSNVPTLAHAETLRKFRSFDPMQWNGFKTNAGNSHKKEKANLSCRVHLTAGYSLSHTAGRWSLTRNMKQRETKLERK